jgi:hypothetical protein
LLLRYKLKFHVHFFQPPFQVLQASEARKLRNIAPDSGLWYVTDAGDS